MSTYCHNKLNRSVSFGLCHTINYSMLQKEDLTRQSDQPVLNSRKWPRTLTIILLYVLLLTMFALGGYWLGARRQQSLPTDLLTKLESNRLPLRLLLSNFFLLLLMQRFVKCTIRSKTAQFYTLFHKKFKNRHLL
jgi:hypothetical protein